MRENAFGRIVDYPEELKELVYFVQRSEKAAFLTKALEMTEKDPHQFSKRPCTTCETITNLIGRPFGCVAMRDRSIPLERPGGKP